MKRFTVVVLVAGHLIACSKDITVPPLVAPVAPRRSLDAQYARLRLAIDEAVDRTGLAGGIVDTGVNGGELRRSGPLLVAPPSRDLIVQVPAGLALGAAAVQHGAPGAPLALSAITVGGGAVAQTLGATLHSVATLSNRFEVVAGTDRTACDLIVRTWVTGIGDGSITVEQVLESCDFAMAISAGTGTIKYNVAPNELQVDREDVKRLVKNLIATLPDPAELGRGEILARDGRFVTINKGNDDRVMKGMKAFAVSYGDQTIDSSGIALGNEVFTGDLYIYAVYPKLSRAVIVTEPADRTHDHSKVRVGDYVVFK